MSRTRRTAPLTAAVISAATLGLTLLSPLSASADDGITDGWSATTPYCALLAGSADMICAGDATTLDAAVDDGALTPDSGTAARTDAGNTTDAEAAALAVVQIARLYDNASFDTAAGYLDVYGNACTTSKTDIDSSQSSLGSYNNRVSSFQSYNNCATKLYTGGSFTGTAYPTSGYLSSSSYVGATMNDNAESARFS